MNNITNPVTTSDLGDKFYIIGPSEKCISESKLQVRFHTFSILKYNDGSEWIEITNRQVERFCGFLYLKKMIQAKNLERVHAAENKITIHSGRIAYLSRYCGEDKIDLSKDSIDEVNRLVRDAKLLKSSTKYVDLSGYANVRLINGEMYIFDTEKDSFDSSVSTDIDAFKEQHDRIRKFWFAHFKVKKASSTL